MTTMTRKKTTETMRTEEMDPLGRRVLGAKEGAVVAAGARAKAPQSPSSSPRPLSEANLSRQTHPIPSSPSIRSLPPSQADRQRSRPLDQPLPTQQSLPTAGRARKLGRTIQQGIRSLLGKGRSPGQTGSNPSTGAVPPLQQQLTGGIDHPVSPRGSTSNSRRSGTGVDVQRSTTLRRVARGVGNSLRKLSLRRTRPGSGSR